MTAIAVVSEGTVTLGGRREDTSRAARRAEMGAHATRKFGCGTIGWGAIVAGSPNSDQPTLP